MLRPTPRLPTASVVDDVFAKLGLDDRERESVGEAFDFEGLTEAELIEAHYLGLLDLECREDTAPDADGGVNVSGKAIAKKKPRRFPKDAWGNLARYATDNQHPIKKLLDRFGITTPGVDSDVPPRDYGLTGRGNYSPTKASNTTGDKDLSLTLPERMVTRLMALRMKIPLEKARYGEMNGVIFTSRSGVFFAQDMINTLDKLDAVYKKHLEFWLAECDPARSTRGTKTFGHMERTARSIARGVSYKAKIGGKVQDYTTFEAAQRWATAHPEVWETLEAELKTTLVVPPEAAGPSEAYGEDGEDDDM
jgi:hypothetical protein